MQENIVNPLVNNVFPFNFGEKNIFTLILKVAIPTIKVKDLPKLKYAIYWSQTNMYYMFVIFI